MMDQLAAMNEVARSYELARCALHFRERGIDPPKSLAEYEGLTEVDLQGLANEVRETWTRPHGWDPGDPRVDAAEVEGLVSLMDERAERMVLEVLATIGEDTIRRVRGGA
jgi:hypothetical protein